MNITQADKTDLDKILMLQKLCYQENAERYNMFDISPLTQTITEIETELKSGTILKATENNQIVGSIRATEYKTSCYIGRVIVHPESQNIGIGKALLQTIEDRYNHCNRYELFTGYRDKKNLYLYQKLGYNIFKKEKLNDKITMVYLEKTSKQVA